MLKTNKKEIPMELKMKAKTQNILGQVGDKEGHS